MGEVSEPLDGWPILLAHHDPFVSSYLERALGRAGATVIGAYTSEHALAGLADWSGFGACLVSIRYHAWRGAGWLGVGRRRRCSW